MFFKLYSLLLCNSTSSSLEREKLNERKLQISKFDKERIIDLITRAIESGHENKKALVDLGAELKKARIVESEDVSADLVTMNTKLVLKDLHNSIERTYTLVFPEDTGKEAGTISILAPIGTAILGYAKGDIIEWPVPSGMRKIKIQDILYQPEAAGDFHL